MHVGLLIGKNIEISMFYLLGLCLQGMGFAEKEALDHYFLYQN